ncbi:hypothetical protein ACFL35_14170, partial [Candidatus Riflebacteria bacterium]
MISIKSTNIATSSVVTGTTTNDRSANVVQGVDLIIGSPTATRITSSITAVDGISFSGALSFTLFDNKGTRDDVDTADPLRGVTFSISAGRYTLSQIVADINWGIQNATNAGATRPAPDNAIEATALATAGDKVSITASLNSSNQLVFELAGTQAALSGNGAELRVSVTGTAQGQRAATYLGLHTTAIAGSGGTAASISGTYQPTNFDADFSGATESIVMSIFDGQGEYASIHLNTDLSGAATSLVALSMLVGSINSQIITGADSGGPGAVPNVEAYIKDTSILAFRTKDTGDGARISINLSAGDGSELGFNDAQQLGASGSGGTDPSAKYTILATSIRKGFALTRNDVNGPDSPTGLGCIGDIHTFHTKSIRRNVANAKTYDQAGAFAEGVFNTITNKLEIHSKTLGETGTLQVTDVSRGAADT